MGKIRKYTIFHNKELLDKGKYKGIHFHGQVERTACRCGHVSPGKIYECPDCGNTSFLYDTSYRTVVSKGNYDIEVIGPDFWIFNYEVEVNLGTELSLKENKKIIMSYEKGLLNVPRWGNEFSTIVFPIMKTHVNELPSKIALAVEQILKYKNADANMFINLVNSGPNLKRLIQNEDKENPLFVGASISRFVSRGYGGTNDVPYTTMKECCNKFKIPAEFHDLLKRSPDIVLERIPHYGTQIFDSGKNWHRVPQEIKNIAWYYYENGIIEFRDYLRLGDIHESIITKTDLVSAFFKKYMMQFQNNIVYRLNEVYNYLIAQGITVDKSTLDYKYFIQHNNVASIKEHVARTEYDIDNFINGLSINAVDAMKTLANTKRIRKI